MKVKYNKNLTFIMVISIILSSFIIFSLEKVEAGSYNGEDLALAILANQSTFVSSSYWDRDRSGTRQCGIFSSLGTMTPTNGSNFVILSTGIAGDVPVTIDGNEPGNERGTWFKNRYGRPRDKAELTMVLQVPQYMHYMYYDFQFFSSEYPEYVGSRYNDKFTVILESPSMGTSYYVCDVNSGNFVLDSNYIQDTGFDIFAMSGNPNNVDIVDRVPREPGADAGATALVTRGGESHPVSPNEQVTVTFSIKDNGDNQFDSAVFIDNLVFLGEARTEILARKSVEDLNGGSYEPEDKVQYSVIISNTGDIDQEDNDGNEFEDYLPENITYVSGSVNSTSGTPFYDAVDNKITWNGGIEKDSMVIIRFQATIDSLAPNGTIISNQGKVFWDSDEDGENDAEELTDDSKIDDGIDQDGDGETYDDDPTNFTIYAFEPPTVVTEDFSDDPNYEQANQTYFGRIWFNTNDTEEQNVFEVAPVYHYSTLKSFKTKIRADSGPSYWNYNLTALEGDIEWWEIYFACGNSSEDADLILDLKNEEEQNIARLKFEYAQEGSDYLSEWVAKMYYFKPGTGWERLNSGAFGGYLYNGWYKIRIDKNGLEYLNYSLYNNQNEIVDLKTGGILSDGFSGLTKLEWSSTKNPIICPMFFWDDHKIGLDN